MRMGVMTRIEDLNTVSRGRGYLPPLLCGALGDRAFGGCGPLMEVWPGDDRLLVWENAIIDLAGM